MRLYGYRNGRTLRALWALEEIGAGYDYTEVDVLHGEGRQPWFLEISIAGKVPVLIDEDLVISESGAICMHLAEKFPRKQLLPPPATPERTQCYQWISFILTELDAPLWTIAKHRFALPLERRVPGAIETAIWEFSNATKILAAGLGQRPYLSGDAFSVVDILAAHTLLWARSARLPFDADTLIRYVDTLAQRDPFKCAQMRATLPSG